MNLTELYTLSSRDELLTDGNWQKANFYDLETNSSFWNKAIIITLSKEFAKTNSDALVYLLQKQAKALHIWENAWKTSTPTLSQFIQFFIVECGFTNTNGYPIAIDLFWKQYITTIDGISAEPSFEFTKNDQIETFINLLHKEDITHVICFDNSWQEHNFFIETMTDWFLYHWSTAV